MVTLQYREFRNDYYTFKTATESNLENYGKNMGYHKTPQNYLPRHQIYDSEGVSRVRCNNLFINCLQRFYSYPVCSAAGTEPPLLKQTPTVCP